jgi:hypothetical protein
MRPRRPLLHLAALGVVVAVSAHLVLHLQSHATGGQMAEAHAAHAVAGSAAALPTVPDPAEDGHAHLMAALCMAVLAVAGLRVTLQLTGTIEAATATLPAVGRGVVGHPLRAPPDLPSRVDAGVLLRV